jgi:hypothetical protein
MSFNEFLNCISVQNVKKAYPEFDKLLSRDELMNVYTGMIRVNNFCDASKILSDVCQRKREVKGRYLSAVKLIKSTETHPSINSYDYVFMNTAPVVEGTVNPGVYGDRESGNNGRYSEPIFKGECTIL